MTPDLFATEDVDLKTLLNAEDRELIGRMKSILGLFILRHLKSDVIRQLVPKIQWVEYVIMEKQQEDAYREAIEKCRTISRACIEKFSDSDINNIVGILPQRQISNYFVQFWCFIHIPYFFPCHVINLIKVPQSLNLISLF